MRPIGGTRGTWIFVSGAVAALAGGCASLVGADFDVGGSGGSDGGSSGATGSDGSGGVTEGGPSVTADGCVRDCTGKSCGDDDGCGSVCDGVCATGQRCLAGTCTCDATSCPNGCCKAGECRAGDGIDACGTGGAACVECERAKESCDARRCKTATGGCGTTTGNGRSCSQICAALGFVCSTGCGATPAAGVLVNSPTCGAGQAGDAIASCADPVNLASGTSVLCCCLK